MRQRSGIGESSPASDLHALRKRRQELRHLVEFFPAALDQRIFRTFAGQPPDLQDWLGESHDAQVQRAAWDAYAHQVMSTGRNPASPLLELGRMARTDSSGGPAPQ